MRQLFHYLFAVVLILLFWSLVSLYFELSRGVALIPYPWGVAAAGAEMWPEWSAAFLESARRFFISLILAFAGGVPLGLFVGSHENINRWFSPLIYLLYPIPPVALLFFLYIAFGVGEAVKVVTVTLTLLFQVTVAAHGAARNISPSHILAVRAAGANSLQLHRHVILPAVMPQVFTSARVSVGLGITMLYIAETKLGIVGGPWSGLGNFIEIYRMRTDLSLAGVVGLAFLGLMFYVILELLERWLCRWKYAGKS